MASARHPVIITRAEPGASETAARVEALGARVILAPVLKLEPDLSSPIPDLSTLSGLVFTSANGVRTFSDRAHQRALTAWCVGPATAAAAREAGFSDVRESAGNAIDLAHFIARNSDAPSAPLLHVANAAAKGDLKTQLEALGYAVSFAPLYAMRPATELPDAAVQAIESRSPALVLIHSAKGAAQFARLCEARCLSTLAAIAISEPASAPLARLHLEAIYLASAPNEDQLIAALEAAIATLSA